MSSREESSLVKVSNIYKKPKIKYIIHSGSLYKKTSLAKYLLKRTGVKFVGHAGQHTITVEKMIPSQMGSITSTCTTTISAVQKHFQNSVGKVIKASAPTKKGKASYYYKYLVDEKKKTYRLVKKFAVPYSSVVSSVQHFDENITFSSGMNHTYGEYDKNGKMIRTFTYQSNVTPTA